MTVQCSFNWELGGKAGNVGQKGCNKILEDTNVGLMGPNAESSWYRGMGKEDVVHIYSGIYYSAIKKNKIMPSAATWMDLEIVILSEVSQTEKDKYHMKLLICGI